jgi:hypothetical protein
MRISANELIAVLNELPKDPKNAMEKRIPKRLKYYNDDGSSNSQLVIDIFFSKSHDKSDWQMELPTIPSQPKVAVN